MKARELVARPSRWTSAAESIRPHWVFVAYKLSGRRDRSTEIAAACAVVVVTATVLLISAL
jgi:hypothetical protein